MKTIIDFLDQNVQMVLMILCALIGLELVIRFLPKKSDRNKKAENSYENMVLGEMRDCVVLLRREDRIPVYISPNMVSLFGVPLDSIYNDVSILYSAFDQSEARTFKNLLAQWDQKEPLCREAAYSKGGEQAGFVSITVSVAEDDRYLLFSFLDITGEEKVRRELKEEIVKVQAIDESKTLFLSKMSHEIRTPMNGMLGMITLSTQSMQAGQYAEAQEYLVKAENLTQFLLSIINDILDMSRIESGKLQLESASFSLFGMAEKLRTMYQTMVEERKIKFSIELKDFTCEYVKGDELRITQVLSNLISNAHKFTPAGGMISITFRQMEVKDGQMSLMLRVKDTGKGMTQEFLHRIFQPFEQEDSGIARKYGGSGLGMAISDNLVKAMGGHILVDSELGKGTEFTVFLQLPVDLQAHEEHSEKQQASKVSLVGRRFLLAEDNDVNALIAMKLLEKKGMLIERAVNGREALKLYSDHEPGYYAAILMDIHMPEMDGWQATQEIRKMERPDAVQIPILAMSADAFVEDRRHSIAMGMNGHIVKPIDYELLEKTLCSCLADETPDEN